MNKLLIKLRNSQNGVVLPGMVIIMLIITASTLSLATFAVNHFSRTSADIYTTNALLVAEAGAEQSLYQLNQDSNFSGYPTEQEFFNNSNQGRATYQTEIIDGSISNEKLVTSTGRVYRRPSDTVPSDIRKVQITVVGTTSSGHAVQTGPGGLILSNSATIANGSVYVNGYITMSNSARIGSSQNPVNVNVAHVNCPTTGGSSYPSQCSSGEPITLTNSASIYGSVCATNQTNGNNMSSPGLQPGCTAPSVSLPDYDRQAQIDSVTTTITGSAASCSGKQTRTWAANTKITGNVTISNSCQVTVNGNVWITGDFNISNSASIKVGNAVPTTPTIMIDGSNGATFSNSSGVLANTSSTGFQFITYWSASGCSPNCQTVTGQDLYNSRNNSTINLSNSSLGAGSLFYARWSKVQLNNGGSVGGVIGQTVQLSNSGNISFGTNLSSGQNVWAIKNYHQVFE